MASEDKDRYPKVTVEIDGTEYPVKNYSIEDNVLNLCDGCSFTLANPDGEMTRTRNRKIIVGDSLKVWMQDRDVQNGKKSLRLLGLVTQTERRATPDGGTEILITGSDLGWHLTHNTGPLHKSLRGITFDKLLKDVVLDSELDWGIKGVRGGNNLNRRLKQGAQAVIEAETSRARAVLPLIQFEPGQMIADTLILYAKREGFLLDMSHDGWLQFFQPKVKMEVSKVDAPLGADYFVRHHRASSETRAMNNVRTSPSPPRLVENLEQIYTDVTLVRQRLLPTKVDQPATSLNPNEGLSKHTYRRSPNGLPFTHRLSFSDSEALNSQQGDRRARWKMDMADLNSYQYEVTLDGHSQGGLYFVSDTLIQIEDTVLGVSGIMYVSSVKMQRTMRDGTSTVLSCRLPGKLQVL